MLRNLRGKELLVVLGADDHEMQRIAWWLNFLGINFIYATKNGRRVLPENAYEANNNTKSFFGKEVVMVECAVQGFVADEEIDHHEEGHFGHSLDYREYLIASSLGQILFFLLAIGYDIVLKKEDYIVAALDHCALDAVQGRCEGISAKDALYHSALQTAKTHGVEVETVFLLVSKSEEIILQQPPRNILQFGEQRVHFLEDAVASGYSLPYLAFLQASFKTEIPIIVTSRHDDNWKFHMVGARPNTVRVFLAQAQEHLTHHYGVETRYYAGGRSHKRRPSMFC
jgi:hypothetical protein